MSKTPTPKQAQLLILDVLISDIEDSYEGPEDTQLLIFNWINNRYRAVSKVKETNWLELKKDE